MRNARLVSSFLLAMVFGLGVLAMNWNSASGIADEAPFDVEEPPDLDPIFDQLIYSGTPSNSTPGASTPIAGDNNQFASVMPLAIGPGQGYLPHFHFGASILVVASGQICVAQMALTDGVRVDAATVTVMRRDRSTKLTADTCNGIKTACPDSEGCEFLPCRDGCVVERNQSFWLGPGDQVIQTNTTQHAMLNVGGPDETANLLNLVVVTNSPETGCAGDCH